VAGSCEYGDEPSGSGATELDSIKVYFLCGDTLMLIWFRYYFGELCRSQNIIIFDFWPFVTRIPFLFTLYVCMT
jgi:hypothetical protein